MIHLSINRNILIFSLALIIIFSLMGLKSSGQSFRKGPYLIYPGNPSQMTILWQTHQTETCRINWGITNQYLDDNQISDELGSGTDEHQHIFTLDNLYPNTKYFYRIICGSDTITSFFHSAVPETAKHLKFLAFGDTRSHPEDMNVVTNRMLLEIEKDTFLGSFLIHSGDFNSSDSESSWDDQFFNRTYPNNIEVQSKMPIMAVRGNHEGNALQYNKYWPYPYPEQGDFYSFDYGPAQFIVVDEYTDFSTGSQQLEWLQNDLTLSNKPWKFICLHEPGYTDESYHQNNQDVQDYIQPLCLQYNVKVVFGGHNHYYAHCIKDGVHHLTLGGGGGALYTVQHIGEGLFMSESTFHFAEVSIDKNTMTIAIVRPDGSIADSLSILNGTSTIEPLPVTTTIKIYIKNNVLVIAGIQTTSTVTIVDLSGKYFYHNKIENSKTQIEISNFHTGVYLISIEGKSLVHKKIIIL